VIRCVSDWVRKGNFKEEFCILEIYHETVSLLGDLAVAYYFPFSVKRGDPFP